MLKRARRAAVVLALLWPSACSPPPDPIIIEDSTIVLRNNTSRDWKNVRVTVNDHFVGGVPLLVAHGRMNAPLSQFQTGFGQRYDITHQVVFKIDVTATDSAGESVSLRWGRDRNK